MYRDDAPIDDTLKTLLVDVWQARHGIGGEWAAAEARIREWLRQIETGK